MCRIRDAGKVKARDRIAVLASLNLAFELSQKESETFSSSSRPTSLRPKRSLPTSVTPAQHFARRSEDRLRTTEAVRLESTCCAASTKRWAATAS